MIRAVVGKLLYAAWQVGWYLPPDRRLLEGTLLPALDADPAIRSVLFVGVARYTRRYVRLLSHTRMLTVDASAARARHGAPQHLQARFEDTAGLIDPPVDAVVLNGVLGHGLNDAVALGAALDACDSVLAPGGLLLLGMNERLATHVDPGAELAARGYVACRLPGLDRDRVVLPTPFREREHTYAGYRRRG